MAKYIELIDKYIVRQDSDTEPPSYIWDDNTGEIVRCGECKYHLPETERTNPYCNRFHCMKPDDWFCADGERKGQE